MYIKHNCPAIWKLEDGAGYCPDPVDWVDAFEEDCEWADAWETAAVQEEGMEARTRRTRNRTQGITARAGHGRIVPATDAEVLREDMRTHTREEAVTAAGRRTRRPVNLDDFI